MLGTYMNPFKLKLVLFLALELLHYRPYCAAVLGLHCLDTCTCEAVHLWFHFSIEVRGGKHVMQLIYGVSFSLTLPAIHKCPWWLECLTDAIGAAGGCCIGAAPGDCPPRQGGPQGRL